MVYAKAEVVGRDESFQTVKRNPPARNTSGFWFERFLTVIQRQNPSEIDATFLSQIAPSNEGKLLAQLKFLHVIDEHGKPTKLLPMLNMVGEEQRNAFPEIVKTSYPDLLNEVKVSMAVPDDLVNFFIRKYSFTRDKAINATKFFLYLCEKAHIQLSPEITYFLERKEPSRQEPTQQRKIRVESHSTNPAPETANHNVVTTVIEIHLDKDTPKEYWDRILTLLGEKRNE